jgi:hypothetical protein
VLRNTNIACLLVFTHGRIAQSVQWIRHRLHCLGTGAGFPAGTRYILLLLVSRLILVTTQPPIQSVLGAIFLGSAKLTTHLHIVLKLRMHGTVRPLLHILS